MKYGIYFYPWYNKTRWAAQPRLCTPSLGEYDSADPAVIRRQVDLLAECGFDYVIFELVPTGDWGFDTVNRSIEIAVERLRDAGIQWSFLMDAFVVKRGNDGAREMNALIRHVEQKGWLEGLCPGQSGRPLLFVFFPVPRDADRLRDAHGSDYELRFPCYMPHWGEVDEIFERFTMDPWGAACW